MNQTGYRSSRSLLGLPGDPGNPAAGSDCLAYQLWHLYNDIESIATDKLTTR